MIRKSYWGDDPVDKEGMFSIASILRSRNAVHQPGK
jgi:hypothetical protein